MCLVAPDVAEYEKGIATLQAEIRTRKSSIAAKETALAAANPPLFQQVQVPPLSYLSPEWYLFTLLS